MSVQYLTGRIEVASDRESETTREPAALTVGESVVGRPHGDWRR